MNTKTIDQEVQKLAHRMADVDHEIALIEMVDEAIQKKTFHHRARKFVESLMTQRELIIQRRVSHKNPYQMLKIIDHLRVNLDAASPKDRSMARYFILYEEEIRSLIPGSYPNKRYETFIFLRDQARDIHNRQLSIND